MMFELKQFDEIETERAKYLDSALKSANNLIDSTTTFYRSSYESFIVKKAYAGLLEKIYPADSAKIEELRENTGIKDLSEIDIARHRVAWYANECVRKLEYFSNYEECLVVQGQVKALLFATGYMSFDRLVQDYSGCLLEHKKSREEKQ